jgi:hypothetical protein
MVRGRGVELRRRSAGFPQLGYPGAGRPAPGRGCAGLGELPHLAGNLMHDAHTAVLMREHGIRVIYTRDTDFHRFPFLELIDPVARRA